MVNIDNIPVFEALVEGEKDGMICVSLVDCPAVLSDFQHFKDERPQMFAISDEDRRLVYGVLMRADFPIYRNDGNGEYYLVFKAETIRNMAQKYLAESRQNKVNIMHRENSDVEGVEMVQMFIKDSARGIAPEGFDNIADGSLFGEYFVKDDGIWNEIKNGTYRGFSIEGYFDFKPEEDASYVQKIVEQTDKFSKQIKMGIKTILRKVLVQCASAVTDKGVLSWDGEDELEVGMEVYMTSEEGERTKPEDGDYTTEEGKVIKVADGKVTEIADAEKAEKSEPEAEAEMAEEEPAPSEIEGLRTEVNELYKLVDGLLKNAGLTRDDIDGDNVTLKAFQHRTEKFSSSYTKRLNDMAASLRNVAPYAYIEDAGEDYLFSCEYDDRTGQESNFRYDVAWNGEKPTLSNKKKVRRAFVYEDAPDTVVSVFKTDIEKMKADIEALKAKPAVEPLHKEFNRNAEVTESRAARIAAGIRK